MTSILFYYSIRDRKKCTDAFLYYATILFHKQRDPTVTNLFAPSLSSFSQRGHDVFILLIINGVFGNSINFCFIMLPSASLPGPEKAAMLSFRRQQQTMGIVVFLYLVLKPVSRI